MKAEVQVFCAMAIGRRLLTLDQCDSLLAACGPAVTLDSFLDALESHGVHADAEALESLCGEIRGSAIGKTKAQPAASEPHTLPPTADNTKKTDTPEQLRLEWFCFHAIVRGALSRQVCRHLAAKLPRPLKLKPFLRAAMGAGLLRDQAVVEELVRKATEETRKGKRPPASMLSDEPVRPPVSQAEQPRRRIASAPREQMRQEPGHITSAPLDSPPPRPPSPARLPIPMPPRPTPDGPRRKIAFRKQQPAATVPPLQRKRAAPSADATATGAPRKLDSGPDVSQPHPMFPFWSCETVYDLISGMYLETPDPAQIAAELSSARGVTIRPQQVEDIRKEAAAAATRHTDVETRRKWMWRHQEPTMNNLVREYIFLAGEKDFRKAKREFGAEIEFFLKTVPADNLLLAVNDALGRSDIEWHVILELAAYHQAATQLEVMAEEPAQRRGISVDAYLREVAHALTTQDHSPVRHSEEESTAYVARWMNQPPTVITSDDLNYLRGLVGSSLEIRTGTRRTP